MSYRVPGRLAHFPRCPRALGSRRGGKIGDPQVFTVEVDEEVADTARANLDRAGYRPTVITGDGAYGHPAGAPYDRIIATCSVQRVPYSWVEQSRPGGLIVTPVETPLNSGGIVRLIVDSHGTASGRFALSAAFMTLRAQQFTAPDEPDDFADQAETSKPAIDVAEALDGAAAFTVGHLVPGCKVAYDLAGGGIIETVWLLAADSWASVHWSTTVRQLGRRRLWDEVEAAFRWWEQAGRPDLTRYGLTLTRDRQQVWLDHPERPVP